MVPDPVVGTCLSESVVVDWQLGPLTGDCALLSIFHFPAISLRQFHLIVGLDLGLRRKSGRRSLDHLFARSCRRVWMAVAEQMPEPVPLRRATCW
jgi:hypothetical protein